MKKLSFLIIAIICGISILGAGFVFANATFPLFFPWNQLVLGSSTGIPAKAIVNPAGVAIFNPAGKEIVGP